MECGRKRREVELMGKGKNIIIFCSIILIVIFILLFPRLATQTGRTPCRPSFVQDFYINCAIICQFLPSSCIPPQRFEQFTDENWLEHNVVVDVAVKEIRRCATSLLKNHKLVYLATKQKELFVIISAGKDSKFAIDDKNFYIAEVIYRIGKKGKGVFHYLTGTWPHRGLGDDIVFVRFSPIKYDDE